MLAAMISTGVLFSAKLWETTTGAAFSGFLSLLQEHVGRPMTVILDNAPIHKAKAEQKSIEYLEGNGMKVCFLPSYSSRAQPNRKTLAQNEVHMDDPQMPRCQSAGGSP